MNAPIPAPGWHPGIPDTEYHASPALCSSFLRTLIGRSPAHARAAQLDPRDESPALILGRAVHARVLEPETYNARFAVAPKVDRRTKEGKATWEAFTLAHPGATILTEGDGDMVNAIGDAVEAHPLARALLSGGEVEWSGFFNDPATGAPCRIRPDYLRVADGIMVDLKTSMDASPREFQRSIARYGYHIQAAHYAAGYGVITETPLSDFLFVVVEKAPPYAVGIYRLDDDAMAQGARTLREALRIAAACLARDHWPAYAEAVEPVTLPAYAFTMEDDA